MASKITAISAYRPRIELGPTVKQTELVQYIAGRIGLTEGTLEMVLKELRDAVIFYNRAGRGVKLEGLGTYLPNLKVDGTFDVEHRLDRDIKNALNAPAAFAGTLLNRDHIGRSADDLIALWNTEHPDDPVA